MGRQVIREATEGDIPALVAMGKEFIEKAGHAYDPACAEQMLRQMVLDDSAVLLVNDNVTAMIGGLVYRHFFNTEMVAQELFWWANGGGLKLLDAFEEWAKSKGATKILMVCLDAIQPERVAKIYTRRGYAPLEHTFARTI